MGHIQYQVFRIDVIVTIFILIFIFSGDRHILPPSFTPPSTFTLKLPISCPRFALEFFNLISFGFFERCVIHNILHSLEEALEVGTFLNISIKRSSEGLPLSKSIRDEDFRQAQSQPWFHNKIASLLTISILLPYDIMKDNFHNKSSEPVGKYLVGGTIGFLYDSSKWTHVEFMTKTLCKDLFMGLIVIDIILGTAHLLSHKGPWKKFLFKYHAKHHSRHHNYSTVKYIGNPFDFEVVLTQVCFSFLPRLLGLDIWTGILLIDIFSLQLLLEHSGSTKIFALSQHHEMHHNYGSVAFYHFPIMELLFGKIPSLEQLSRKKVT